jgi:hypothetical protein
MGCSSTACLGRHAGRFAVLNEVDEEPLVAVVVVRALCHESRRSGSLSFENPLIGQRRPPGIPPALAPASGADGNPREADGRIADPDDVLDVDLHAELQGDFDEVDGMFKAHRRFSIGRLPVRALPRHTTMRDAIAWSYDLLTTEEERLFRRPIDLAGGRTLSIILAKLGISSERDTAA